MKCPSLTSLLEYVREQLSADERTAVLAHISAGCPACQENQRWLSTVLHLTSEDISFEFPEETIQWAVAQFKAKSAISPSPLRQFFAQLVFDSLTPRRLADIRSDPAHEGVVSGRQMLFHAEGYDIDLRFEQVEGSELEELIGQILSEKQPPTELAPLSAQLLRDDTEIGRVQTNALGIFKFTPVPSGVYSLKIQVPEGEINILKVATARAS
jgi:hypothetical protein